MTEQFDLAKSIDTCGTRCPIPLLRAKQALKELQVGDYLEVLATDPSAKPDFDAMLKHLPHELFLYQKEEGYDRFVIKKGDT